MIRNDRIIVKYKRRITPAALNNIHRSSFLIPVKTFKKLGMETVSLRPGEDLMRKIEELSRNKNIEFAEPVILRKAHIIPSEYSDIDALETSQWGLKKIDAPASWDIETGNDAVVAVIDSGIDLTHGDLQANIWQNSDEVVNAADSDQNGKVDDIKGWDFVDNDNDPSPNNANETHGTHVAGIIAASANNGGVVGVSWSNKLMPIKCLYYDGIYVVGSSDDIIEGIIYAADNGADIINMSYGGGPDSSAEKAALDYAYNKGVVLIASSGNENSAFVSYPAAYDNVIAVGATDSNDDLASFSNYGEDLDIVAPGVNILSTIKGGGYALMSGTSMACPFVSGVASLVISYWNSGYNTSWTPLQVKNAVISNTEDINGAVLPGKDKFTGTGRLNSLESIEFARSGAINIDEKKVLVYPNPFDPDIESTNIVLPIGGGSIEKMYIYSLSGELVYEETTDSSIADWDGKNMFGEYCGSGLYFYYLETTLGAEKGKLTLLR